MDEGSEPNCDRYNYYSHGNHTLIIQGFEGIPQNLLVNVGSMLVSENRRKIMHFLFAR